MRSTNTRVLWLLPLMVVVSTSLTFALVPIEGAAALTAPSGTPESSGGALVAAAVSDHQGGHSAQAAAAQENASAPRGASIPDPNSGALAPPNEADNLLLARTLGSLGLVISFILIGYLIIQRFGPKCLRRPSDRKSLRIIETLPMGEKRSIALIQFGVQQLLIGNTAGQITLLLQVPAAPEDRTRAVEPKNVAKAAAGAVAGFRKLYEVEKNAAPPRPVRPLPPDLREKMRQLREALEK